MIEIASVCFVVFFYIISYERSHEDIKYIRNKIQRGRKFRMTTVDHLFN